MCPAELRMHTACILTLVGKHPPDACETSGASEMSFAHVFGVAAQVTEEDVLAEEQGSCRSLGTSDSLGSSASLASHKKGASERTLKPEAVEEAPAKTRRRGWPWGKPKAEKEDKPAKQVGAEWSRRRRRTSASLVRDWVPPFSMHP